ncbi:transcription antitermination factor NusB [Aphanothece hegewaldii CCALA 016]|uniref:Transcription antitermination protein NusB n=1 Tax=Aphanothece hegewaldii CCALA 016 TaxID=2107694 RepID=A0A2T1LT62_9CHRO|nr:transcription antitermination factor NusB [Aphanothece hegewaldii]PSF33608.1 transcription antitermination factor NusB [Aphanothece hegewaldii CCALA 016]
MPPRQQPRRISRELALLGLSQIKSQPEKLEQTDLNELVLAAVRTLTTEIRETLETASGEVHNADERLISSDTRATNLKSAQTMVREALELTQSAINRLAIVIDFPERLQLSSQYEVRGYALELIGTVYRRQKEIEQIIESALVDWQLNRLAKIDRDILRIAVSEMMFLDIPHKVAINEAVELAKRYSDEEGYRFVNGVLRRVTDKLTVNS